MLTNNKYPDETIPFLKQNFGDSYSIKPLQEEASTRRYFEIEGKDKKNVICFDHNINEDFVLLARFLSENGIRVPQVIDIERSLGLLVLTWEGKYDLSSLPIEQYKKRLPDAIELLLCIQKLEPPDLVRNRKFDLEKLSFEINLTKEKYISFQNMFTLESSLTNEVIAFLEETIGYLDKHPINVFTHRDFHSRNILINEDGGLSLIDFQDARMGVPQYDLASILYDAYYPLPREFRLEILSYFQKKTIGGNVKFKEAFYLQALQRSFKALGTYFRMVVDEKKNKFKPSILSCLEQLEEIVQIGMFADSIYIFIRSLRNELSKHPSFKSDHL